MNHHRMSKRHLRNKEIEFLNFLAHDEGEGMTFFRKIFRKVEILLTTYNLKHFTLKDSNSREYNLKALKEFEQISETYEQLIEIFLDKRSDKKEKLQKY